MLIVQSQSTDVYCDLQILSLSALGVTKTDFPVLIEKAQQSGGMKTNPVELTEQELTNIVQEAL